MNGGAPRVVWFIWPADPHGVSAKSAAQRLVQLHRPAHLVWNPVTGQIVQSLPPTLAASGLNGDLNRQGRVCIQIRVLGSVDEPFTDGRLDGLDDILTWLDSWEVPRRWPAGPPLPYPLSVAGARDKRVWARGGHFGHSQVPCCNDGDPGTIDVGRLIGREPSKAMVNRSPRFEFPLPREELAREEIRLLESADLERVG